MKMKNKIRISLLNYFVILLITIIGAACTDDKEVFQADKGYVQFKVYKSESYVKMRPLVQVETCLIHFMKQIK